MSNTSTIVAGIPTSSYIGTASGALDMTPEEIEALAGNTEFFSLKSTGADPANGNPEPRLIDLPHGTMQSMGLPNIGLQSTLQCIRQVSRPGLVIKASIAGKSIQENQYLMCSFQQQPEISLIEINFSCPNKPGEKIVSKELKALDYNLDRLMRFGSKPVGVKLPYYGDLDLQLRVIDILFKHEVNFATMINGILGLDIDVETERPTIRPNGGRGAISGQYIQQLALLEVYNFYNLSKGAGIDIIGVGGISTGADAYKFLLAGACAVEVGSQLVKEGVGSINRINTEFTDILARKRTTISETKGALKAWDGV